MAYQTLVYIIAVVSSGWGKEEVGRTPDASGIYCPVRKRGVETALARDLQIY